MTPLVGALLALGAALPSPVPPSPLAPSRLAPPPAASTGTGLIGFLIVLGLCVASGAIYVALRGSMRRLRAREQDGSFGAAQRTRRGH